jgi:hypothetical protein
MSDAELQLWHATLRDYKNHMTFTAAIFPVKQTKTDQSPKDISEFV